MKNLISKYNTFIKYLGSAGICFFIDLTLFTIFNIILKKILGDFSIIVATIVARIISSSLNYYLNRNKIFNVNDNKNIDSNSFFKYVLLVIIQMFVSSFSVLKLYNLLNINESIIKIFVDCVLLVFNFFIQKFFIFNTKIKKEKGNIILLIIAIITSMALIYNPVDNNEIIKITYNFNVIISFVLTCLIFWYYKKFYNLTERRNSLKVVSVIFTLLLIFGYSFHHNDSGFLVYGNIQYFILSIIKLIGYYSFINLSLNLLYEYLHKMKVSNIVSQNKLVILFKKNPFIFSIVSLSIVYLIYVIAYYPGVVGYDPSYQIKEVMGIPNFYSESIHITGNSLITAFNPVLHTLLIGYLFKFGVLIGNVNIGIFIYTIIQVITTIIVLSYSISFLHKEKVPDKFLLILLGIYIFVPIFPYYAICAFKDTYFSLLFMLYVIRLYKVIKYKMNIRDMILLTLVCIGLCLLRNNGIYTILLSLPFFIIFIKDNRKLVSISLLLTILLYLLYNLLLNVFNVYPTSIREALSVPFQQTAALVSKNEEVIEEKDKEIISKILDYDTMKNEYNPELSDKVKNTFNNNSSTEELLDYFGVWFKYLWKEPIIYIDATINNMYGYFYPEAQSWYFYHQHYNVLNEVGYDYHYNQLDILRSILSGYGEAFAYIPIIGLTVNIGIISWVYIYLTASLIESKNKKFILLFIPAFTIILACIVGPVNTYYRYVLPYSMTLPLILCLLYKNK